MKWLYHVTLVLAFALTGCALTPRNAEQRAVSANLLNAEIAAARAVATKPVPFVFVGVAMNSQSRAFQADVLTTQKTLASLADTEFPSILLSNNLESKRLTYPFATPAAVAKSIAAASELGDANTPVVVLFSTHGTINALAMAIGYDDYPLITGEELSEWLAPLGSRPVILIISACHAGSLAPTLYNAHRAIFFAAAPDRSSFGCDFESTNTYFIEEFFGRSTPASATLSQMMQAAQGRIAERELSMNAAASNPGYVIPDSMRRWTDTPLRAWPHAADKSE